MSTFATLPAFAIKGDALVEVDWTGERWIVESVPPVSLRLSDIPTEERMFDNTRRTVFRRHLLGERRSLALVIVAALYLPELCGGPTR